jgi:exoribonuclease R
MFFATKGGEWEPARQRMLGAGSLKLPRAMAGRSCNPRRRKKRYRDLSLAVIKLMGPGEYVLERPGDPEPGHFGLAVEDYTHSTAPNRRFATS